VLNLLSESLAIATIRESAISTRTEFHWLARRLSPWGWLKLDTRSNRSHNPDSCVWELHMNPARLEFF